MALERKEGESVSAMYVRVAEELVDRSSGANVSLAEGAWLAQRAQVYATLAVATAGK